MQIKIQIVSIDKNDLNVHQDRVFTRYLSRKIQCCRSDEIYSRHRQGNNGKAVTKISGEVCGAYLRQILRNPGELACFFLRSARQLKPDT